MSFGFSVPDIYVCARLAFKLYDEFKSAPAACQEFAQELLLFHQVLIKTGAAINSEPSDLSSSDRDALRLCLDSCKELLCVRIMGAQKVPEDLEKSEFDPHSDLFDSKYCDSVDGIWGWHTWRNRFEKRKLALRIPNLQRAISVHIEKLNALITLYYQSVSLLD